MNDLKEIHQNILNLSENLFVQVLFYDDVEYSLIDRRRLLNASIKYVFNSEIIKWHLIWLFSFFLILKS